MADRGREGKGVEGNLTFRGRYSNVRREERKGAYRGKGELEGEKKGGMGVGDGVSDSVGEGEASSS